MTPCTLFAPMNDRPRARGRARAAAVRGVQKAIGLGGYEIRRLEDPDPAGRRRAKLMRQERIDLLLDVGANAGQYGQRTRRAGYRGQIISFEPLADAYRRLTSVAAEDPAWETRRLALAEEDGTARINVAANSWSSSLLPMGTRHLHAAPESAFVRTEEVLTARLDSIWDEMAAGYGRPWLKLDVQGFELHVLLGAADCLDRIRAVQAELSLVPLYEGDTPWRALIDWLGERGFLLAGIETGFEDPKTGRMLQFDGIFLRQ
jgi:FkbM family methyltransferase